MRTLLICHHDAPLDREGLVRWLGSFSTLAGTVVIREAATRRRRRIVREIKRVGIGRFLDVLAFRFHYALTTARADKEWERRELERLRELFPAPAAPEIVVDSPNGAAAEQFIRDHRPDLVIARCKTILKEQVFSIPARGTFVMHPGICPEYRNAHGCFWALAQGDVERVGMTLLQIDKGVDTGPIYGFFSYPYDERRESHIVIQARTVLDNLDAIRDRLTEIVEGRARALDVRGHGSAVWGQPWLTKYAAWKLRARRKAS